MYNNSSGRQIHYQASIQVGSNAFPYSSSKHSCPNIFNIFSILNNNNTSYCHRLVRIATPCLLFAKLYNTIIKLSNQGLRIYILVLTLIIASLFNMRHINFTNQFYPIAIAKDLIKKRYIILIIMSLTCIQRAFMQFQTRMSKRFNPQISVLIRQTQILLVLKPYVQNMKASFIQNLCSTSISRIAALLQFSFYSLIPLSCLKSYLFLILFQNPRCHLQNRGKSFEGKHT